MSDSQKIKFSNTSRYVEIVKKAYGMVESFVTKRNNELKKNIDHHQLIKYAESVHNEAMITVVFCTMALEAYINKYGIMNSSRRFF